MKTKLRFVRPNATSNLQSAKVPSLKRNPEIRLLLRLLRVRFLFDFFVFSMRRIINRYVGTLIIQLTYSTAGSVSPLKPLSVQTGLMKASPSSSPHASPTTPSQLSPQVKVKIYSAYARCTNPFLCACFSVLKTKYCFSLSHESRHLFLTSHRCLGGGEFHHAPSPSDTHSNRAFGRTLVFSRDTIALSHRLRRRSPGRHFTGYHAHSQISAVWLLRFSTGWRRWISTRIGQKMEGKTMEEMGSR